MTHKILISTFLVMTMTVSAQTRELSVKDLPCKPSAPAGNSFYGYGFAESSDLSVARNKALLQATRELSASMRSQMQAVTDLYTEGTPTTQSQTFENLITETVNETLDNPEITCQKQESSKGKTRVYIALELKKEIFLNKIESKAGGANEVDFDKARFEEIFNKETATGN